MSLYEQSSSVRAALLSQARERLGVARSQIAVIETVRQTARDICASDGITFILRDGDECHYVEEDAISPLWKGQRFAMTACISGCSMLNAQTAVIHDVFTDPRIPHDVYRRTFVKSLIMTPVGEKGPVAALGAYWQDKRSFTEREIAAVKTMAEVVGRALAHLI